MDSVRVELTRRAMAEAGLEALIVRLPENVLLLSGHWPLVGASFLYFPAVGRALCVVPHCDEKEAREELWEAECVSYLSGVLGAGDPYEEIRKALRRVIGGGRPSRVGCEGGFESVAPAWNAAEGAVPAAATRALLAAVAGEEALTDATALLCDLRSRKTPLEQEKLRRVNEIAAMGLEAFADKVDIGVSGVELVACVEEAVLLKGTGHRGARRVRAFAQVSTGPEESLAGFRPMVISTRRKLEDGDIALLELGVVADGFWSDRTRVRVAGTPTAQQREVFEVVRRAGQAAVAAAGPGATCGAVDEAARRVVREAGYGKEFLHVTGHGVGLRYHEPVPLVCPGGATVLEPGMVHSVEPGIYREGFGGMRLEDDVLVTPDGVEVLGLSPMSL